MTAKPRKTAKKTKKSGPDVNIFIAEYKVDRNGRRAAIAAGYSEKTAAAQASRLLRNVNIRAEVDSHHAAVIAKVQEETGITLERTLREIARGAFFDVRRLFDANGEPLPITELDDDTAAVIAGLETATERARGEDAGQATFIRKYKISDRKGYLDMLMKHLGGYEVDNAQKSDPLRELLASMGRSALPVVKKADGA